MTFSTAGFDVTDVTVNGKTMPMSQYVTATNMDRTLPLVANYMGAYVNVSFRITGDDTNSVKFAAPVFPGIEYRQAKPIKNYENEFRKALAKHDVDNSFFACNCYLNYQYANLEGKIVGKKSTAMTFGEIAYMLLNQTYVYLTIEKKSATEN